MMTDWQLIQRFTEQHSQSAFTDLARRHIDMVYGTCLRELDDPSLAEDATQAVFLVLARKAASFRRGTTLSSWLYRTALLTSKNIRRQERRRQVLEQAAAVEAARATGEGPRGCPEVEALLHDALRALSPAQRALILERFLSQRPLAEIAEGLGVSEDAARMRLNRALDRMRRWFTARNVVLSAAALAAGLTQAFRSAPARCADVVRGLPTIPPTAAPAVPLAHGAIHAMNTRRHRLQWGAAALVVVLSLATARAVSVRAPAEPAAVPAATAQGQDAARAVLDRMYATYGAMHSFRCNVTSREDPLGTAQDADYEIERPNRVRFRRVTLIGGPDMSGQATAVSDGSNLYVTCTENKGRPGRYAKMPLGPSTDHGSWFADFGGIPAWGTEPYAGMPSVALGLRPPRGLSLSAPEYSLGQPVVLDLPGVARPVALDVVIARMHSLAPVSEVKDDPEVVTYYIGQRDHLLYKLTAAYLVSPTQWDTRTETYYSVEVNPKLAPSDFAFTPPPGGHEVKSTSDLFPGGRM